MLGISIYIVGFELGKSHLGHAFSLSSESQGTRNFHLKKRKERELISSQSPDCKLALEERPHKYPEACKKKIRVGNC